MSTIFAVSSGRPPAAIAVLRVSGPDALSGVSRLAGRLPQPRLAGLRTLRAPDGGVLDQALVLVFPGPNSATGEDLVELHCHGGRAVVMAVEAALGEIAGFRPAEPGEFTRRALMNGRIDLAEAEGLADLLQAETETQRVVAMSAVEGRVSSAVRGWMQRISLLSARIEAMLDFADEDDVADDAELVRQIGREMAELGNEIAQALALPSVDRLRDGIRVVLAGPPNSGKSTLLNLMSQREAAIVSSIAGTTRDRIEAAVTRGGLPFVLTDTAGLTFETDDPIERIGVTRAEEAIANADVLVWLGDDQPPRVDALWVHARADMEDRHNTPTGRSLMIRSDRLKTIDTLWDFVTKLAEDLVPAVDRVAFNARQRECLELCRRSLSVEWTDPLIGGEQLRRAGGALASLLGLNATEAMLDAMFGAFCIGK
ncbi:tRNA modification GTPase trmE [Sphingomonas gellani]|uniref:tRNA modification GTPase MnmE n=1 Tax=Sphingomonas gellani TaxID=1166340 RepID=A0A1H8HE81_9SPHN|nr:tRNA uridine-5-carboxymethylaminomethyl(34) synthesis GTPase MnmE [Sphingomonas gellani]SEN54503.1 tRNA modification GTPase trmE [Sphingomonas gellani]